MLRVYNPQMQIAYTKDQRRAYMGQSPHLGVVGRAFSPGVAKTWVTIQLWDLAEFSGCKKKLSERQIDELSQIICVEYGYMKLTELMDFFRRFKNGEYGKFYGSVDPMVITCALRDFSVFRIAQIRQFEKEDDAARLKIDPREVKRQRALAREDAMLRFYAANFRYSVDFTSDDFREIWWLFNMGYERKDHGYKDRK